MNDLMSWVNANLVALLSLIAAVASAVAADGAARAARRNADLVDKQVNEAVAGRRHDALLRAYDRVNEPETVLARSRVLLRDLPEIRDLYTDPRPGFFRTKAKHHAVYLQMRSVWITYDQLGLLVSRGLIDPEDAYEIGPWADECWTVLEPYISFERTMNRPRHMEHFEKFARDSAAYWQRRNVETPMPARAPATPT